MKLGERRTIAERQHKCCLHAWSCNENKLCLCGPLYICIIYNSFYYFRRKEVSTKLWYSIMGRSATRKFHFFHPKLDIIHLKFHALFRYSMFQIKISSLPVHVSNIQFSSLHIPYQSFQYT